MQYKINNWLLGLLIVFLAGCTESEPVVQEPPTLTASEATDVTRNSATLTGSIKLTGSTTVKEYGLAYSTVSSMAEENTELIRISYNSSQSTYEVKLTGLTPGTCYYYRFYANNGYTETYSEKRKFTTNAVDKPVLDAVTLIAATESSAEVKCKIIDKGGSDIQEYGFAYKKVGTTEEKLVSASNQNNAGEFSLVINDLEHSAQYEIRAYAKNAKGTGFSESSLGVSTSAPATPSITIDSHTADYESITVSAALHNAEIASGITEVGFYWGKEQANLETKGTKVIAELKDNKFTTTISNLEQNTVYYIKAYAVNKQTVTGSSDVVSIVTARRSAPTLGALTLDAASEKEMMITATVTDYGSHELTRLGYEYILPNTTEEVKGGVALDKLNSNGTFQFKISNLTPGSTYKVRTYAVNEVGTGYSEYASFATIEQKEPVLEMSAGTVTSTTIALNAAVTDKGSNNAILTETGFVYSSTNTTPGMADIKVVVEGGQSTYSTVLANLAPNTTYYIRAYAKNDTKTGYSDVKQVTTSRSDVPAVTTGNVTGITANSVVVTGTVTDNGNNSLTGIGFVYKTSTGEEKQYPVDLINQKNDNTFTATLTGLVSGTAYKVCAYATNIVGTGYGGYVDFTTTELEAPSVTLQCDSIMATAVNVKAEVLSAGSTGATVKRTGFCWSTTNAEPKLDVDNTMDVTLTGTTFEATINGLKGETKYYIRAFAINDDTIGYSDAITVTTLVSKVPDIDDNPTPDITN